MVKADFDLRENLKLVDDLRRCAGDSCKGCKREVEVIECFDDVRKEAADALERTTKHLEFWVKKAGAKV